MNISICDLFVVQIGEALDSWRRFLDMHSGVMSWSADKSNFLQEPLVFSTLAAAKQKLQEYAISMKTIKAAGKSLQEMSREMAVVSQVADTDDFGQKLHTAEQKKADAEARLTERVS